MQEMRKLWVVDVGEGGNNFFSCGRPLRCWALVNVEPSSVFPGVAPLKGALASRGWRGRKRVLVKRDENGLSETVNPLVCWRTTVSKMVVCL